MSSFNRAQYELAYTVAKLAFDACDSSYEELIMDLIVELQNVIGQQEWPHPDGVYSWDIFQQAKVRANAHNISTTGEPKP